MNPLADLGALRAWAAAARPVFICGQERSGTSALQLALARHPALSAVPDVFETFVFSRARELLTDPPATMQQGYLGGPASLAALRASLARLGDGDPARLTDDDLIRAFFAFAATEVYPGRRPLEKTPTHVQCLPRVFALFPRACVLACVRDPVEVAGSYRRRLVRERALGKSPEDWGWLDQTDEQLVHRYRCARAFHSDSLTPRTACCSCCPPPRPWTTNAPCRPRWQNGRRGRATSTTRRH